MCTEHGCAGDETSGRVEMRRGVPAGRGVRLADSVVVDADDKNLSHAPLSPTIHTATTTTASAHHGGANGRASRGAEEAGHD